MSLASVSGALFARDVAKLWSMKSNAATFTPPPTVKIIGQYGLFYMSALRDVRLGPSVEVVEKFSFSSTLITKFVVPDNLREIRDFAFADCA